MPNSVDRATRPRPASAEPAAPIPRKMALPFDETIPRHWMHDNVLGTHLSNGLNLLFPLGERFFVRSVRHYLDELDDEQLVAQVRGFFGQEGLHAREHERFFAILRGQGFDVDRFLRFYQWLGYDLLEPRFSPQMRLAITAACEHFTAMFAENALGTDMLEDVHPAMQQLLRWHAAEEIEHKAVAFDVLERVNPSYPLRVAGLTYATIVLTGFWMLGTAMLLRQEPPRPLRKRLRDAWEVLVRNPAPNMARSFIRYLRPGFHPSDIENYALASGYLEAIGRQHG